MEGAGAVMRKWPLHAPAQKHSYIPPVPPDMGTSRDRREAVRPAPFTNLQSSRTRAHGLERMTEQCIALTCASCCLELRLLSPQHLPRPFLQHAGWRSISRKQTINSSESWCSPAWWREVGSPVLDLPLVSLVR